MKLAIMQPYFLPYLGYFSLINQADTFILLDEVQFIRHGWIERNRILNSNEGWQYIKVPLIKHSRNTLIKDIEIRNEDSWQTKFFAQLVCYKRKAPYYNEVIAFLKPILAKTHDTITNLNFELLVEVLKYLEINTKIEVFSEMNYNIEDVEQSGDWALNISKFVGASTYINPIDGENLFDKNKFNKEKIKLKFIKTKLTAYNQNRDAFESGLSIIDVMMFCDKNKINQLLNNANYITV